MHGGSRRGSHPQARAGEPRGSKARGQARGSQARGSQARGSQDRPNSRGAGPKATQPVPLPDTDRLASLLEPVVHALNMDLEGVRVSSAGRRRVLRVFVDADGGVSLDDIALASRELSIRLDDAALMGDLPYTLEVSSPGVDRPLTLPRHWRRAIGRLVAVPLKHDTADHGGNGARSADGRIVASSDRGVTLEHDGTVREYTYAELGPGRVQVEFGHFGDDELGDQELGDAAELGEED
jgi:ribosome maturation factor RimP